MSNKIDITVPFKLKQIKIEDVEQLLTKEKLYYYDIKYDGVCCYKTGDKYYSKIGNLLTGVENIPSLCHIPNGTWGELYCKGRSSTGDIGLIQSYVKRLNPVAVPQDHVVFMHIFPAYTSIDASRRKNQVDGGVRLLKTFYDTNVVRSNAEGVVLITETAKGFTGYKIKPCITSEFKSVSFNEGEGKSAGLLASITCLSETGHEFNAGVGGSVASRQKLLRDYSNYGGLAYVTLAYTMLLPVTMVPRYGGTLVTVRDYE